MSAHTISKSSMGMYLNCPKSYFYGHIAHAPSKVDYPRLMGSEVHRFTARLYAKHKNPSRPFFYTDLKKAHNAWFSTWSRVLTANKDKISFPDVKKSQEHAVTGWVCIKNYWNASIDRVRPLYIEKRLVVPIMRGYKFVGIFDQIRQAPLESIRKFRPDLIVDDQLIDGYDPAFIVDLKTNRQSYDLTVFKPDADPLEQAAYQFALHEDLQVTAYYWLYWQNFHKLPAGFFWWHLRSGNLFYTYRTVNDFPTFLEQVEFMLDGMDSASFPKSVGAHCKFCDYFEVCGGSRIDRPLMVTKGVKTTDDAAFVPVISDIKIERATQLRFKNFNVPRAKKEKPKASEVKASRSKIVTLPADDSIV